MNKGEQASPARPAARLVLSDEVELVRQAIRAAEVIVVDTETSSLFPNRDGRVLAGLGVKPLDGPSFYLPIRHRDSANVSISVVRQLCEELRGKLLVFHNPKFDLAALLNDEINLVNEGIVDTVVLTRLISEDEPSYELRTLAKKYVDELALDSRRELKKLLRAIKTTSYADVPADVILSYVADDLRYTEALFRSGMLTLERRDTEDRERRNGLSCRTLSDVLVLERRVMPELFFMERRGCLIDRSYIERELAALYEMIRKRRAHAHALAGGSFNVNSPREIGRLFTKLGIASPLLTKKGAQSWSKNALLTINHPLAPAIISWRNALLVKNYYENFVELADADGVIHCSFHQAGARTGRMSARNPNLQNIPKRGRYAMTGIDMPEEAALLDRVRGAFVPRPDCFFLVADWSQIELRILADYADEQTMLVAFKLGLDIHSLTARAAYGPLPAMATLTQRDRWRRLGKDVGFGLIFGIGVKSLSARIGQTLKRTTAFIDRYFARFPSIRRFIDKATAACEQKGWAKNKWGRRRYLASSIYRIVNFLVQGTAADFFKDAFVRVSKALREAGLAARPLIAIHDELLFEVPYVEAEVAVSLIVAEMEASDRLKVPVKCDLSWTPTRWGDEISLACRPCDGYGTVLSVPRGELFDALYNDVQLDVGASATCRECGGLGYSLSSIKEHAAGRHDYNA